MSGSVLQLYPGVKISGDLVAFAAPMQVWLWDCGPTEPDLPEPPEAPTGKEGDPKFDLQKLQFRRKLKHYEDALLAYEKNLADFKDWQTRYGGPIELQFWSCDARDALLNDKAAVDEGRQVAARYHISHRTRGYEKVVNMGLPEGVKPGRSHQENMRREADRAADLHQAMMADPVFGQEARP